MVPVVSRGVLYPFVLTRVGYLLQRLSFQPPPFRGAGGSPDIHEGVSLSEATIDSMLNSYLRDAHAMERNVNQMLASMIATTPDATIREGLEKHQQETKEQMQRLAERLDARGEDTSTLKDAGAVMGAFFKGMADIARSDKAGKNARDGFVTEALEIASYQLLERLAERAGDQETAEVARINRAEEEAMRERIDSNWDRFIDLVLEEQGVAVS
jgi:ferritin-like metal-binding protein YciE